jgi:uncharacterized protein
MRLPSEATLLRIVIGYDDAFEEKPLCEQIVLKARAMGTAGATVTRGILAYGPASKELAILLRHSEDAPIVIEIVDSEEKIMAFAIAANAMIESGLVTLQKVSVLRNGRETD